MRTGGAAEAPLLRRGAWRSERLSGDFGGPLLVATQCLKHTAECRSTCFWGLLVGVLKHAAACRGTLKIGLRLLGGGDIGPKYQSHP